MKYPAFNPKQCAALLGFIPLGMATVTHADPNAAAVHAQASTVLHLLEGGRSGEAIPAAQRLVEMAPADPLAYQVRGTVEFYVGSLRPAQDDWVQAATLSPRLPATRYALALCDFFGGRADAAGAELARMSQVLPLSPAHLADANTARAYALFLGGNLPGASALAPVDDPAALVPDPLRVQMAAQIAARRQPAQGIAFLTAFLQTPSGCPRVTEEAGLRARFESGTACIEPSVVEPPLRQMYAASLADNRKGMQKAQKDAPHVSGDVTLTADMDNAGRVSLVSFSVDGSLVGMVNTAPYRFVWHTAQTANGWHVIRTEALDAAGGVVSSHDQTLRVDNTAGGADVTTDSDAVLQARLWNLLRLRPTRKSAEWTLAALLDNRGDGEAADAHRAVAAALDPDYRNARAVVRGLFRNAGARAEGPRVRLASTHPDGLWIGPAASVKQVALTFDDGPNPLKTPALLDALDKAHCPATFFVVGSRAEAAPDLVRRMVARGDEVENHSYTHPNMAQVAPIVAEAEILRASVVIRSLSGRLPRFFRPPGGNSSPSLLATARAYGQTGAFWTEDVLHYEDLGSPDALQNYVLDHLHPGSIVLLHNGADATVAAIPTLVNALRARGYQIVTLSQLANGTPGAAPVHLKE